MDPDFTWQSKMLKCQLRWTLGSADPARCNVQRFFKRVPLDDPRWGGVITNAAVMTMTSTPTRTQPITRGAWINAVIFNDPPEPPPADVPPLPEVDVDELAKFTIRERSRRCIASVPTVPAATTEIDPLGFALENYGPTGIWRDTYENGREVDPSGVLFNQTRSSNPCPRIQAADCCRTNNGSLRGASSRICLPTPSAGNWDPRIGLAAG